MTDRLAGRPPRRWVARWPGPLAAALAAGLIWPMSAVAQPAASAAVPLPRPSPSRPPPVVAPADTIGAIIADTEAREAASQEDADVAESRTGGEDSQTTGVRSSRQLGSTGLDLAIKLIAAGDFAGATVAAYALPNRVDIKIVDWLIATSGDRQVPASRIAETAKRLADWPGQALLRLRYEQAIAREKPAPAEVIKALGGTRPTSEDAALLLTAAYRDASRKDEATAIIRDLWQRTGLSSDAEKQILADFAGLLTPADHKARMDRLLYDGKRDEALRTAKLLDAGQQALAKAVVAVIRGQSSALKSLDALPAAVKKDPLAVYSRVQTLRRANRITDAATLLTTAPRDAAALVDPDAWWIERRLVSRQLIDIGNAKLAYQVAAGHAGESQTLRAEAEFHAGWYALEFLRQPKTAADHFAAIKDISSRALSASRAYYWMGRAAEASGDKAAATAHYRNAATFDTAFYGQLALARLDGGRVELAAPPPADAVVTARFAARELVQVIQRLTGEGVTEQLGLFYRSLAGSLTDPAEIALLAQLADDNGLHQVALQVGVIAQSRGLPVETLAFPTAAIPPAAATPTVERPLVYAVARQESSFNAEAVSSAGALGLLQLLPGTAREAAQKAGISYSKARLTDPGYNATLGAVHLGGLIDDFAGSYVLTFAAYNAGPGRVATWIKAYGDPRDPKVDVIDWIERIPFTETRNYVQRTMENLQAYRARFGSPSLDLGGDLKRGGRD